MLGPPMQMQRRVTRSRPSTSGSLGWGLGEDFPEEDDATPISGRSPQDSLGATCSPKEGGRRGARGGKIGISVVDLGERMVDSTGSLSPRRGHQGERPRPRGLATEGPWVYSQEQYELDANLAEAWSKHERNEANNGNTSDRDVIEGLRKQLRGAGGGEKRPGTGKRP
eukprot:1191290-Prorocentrum_minimum.AAC.1